MAIWRHYSFYLFHGLAIVVFCDRIGPHLRVLSEGLRFGVLLAGSFALSIGVAVVSYRLLEKPYFDRKHGARAAALKDTEQAAALVLAERQ